MMGFFDELTRMNVAWCESHGLSVGEAYGTKPNIAELETSRLIACGVPSESAGMFAAGRMDAERIRVRRIVVRLQRESRLRNRNYAPGKFINFVNREQWIRSHKEES